MRYLLWKHIDKPNPEYVHDLFSTYPFAKAYWDKMRWEIHIEDLWREEYKIYNIAENTLVLRHITGLGGGSDALNKKFILSFRGYSMSVDAWVEMDYAIIKDDERCDLIGWSWDAF